MVCGDLIALIKNQMITKEIILNKFPNAEKIRFSDFMGNDIVLFESNYYAIEIRTIDEGYLVVMDKFSSRNGVSEIATTVEGTIDFINEVFLNGL